MRFSRDSLQESAAIFTFLLIALACILIIVFSFKSCRQVKIRYKGPYKTYQDQEGNQFKSVKIGGREWMESNLKSRIFQNGDTIFLASNADEWKEANQKKIAACCWFQFNSTKKYNGLYYNHYAVSDPRGLAPRGWSIPNVKEFDKDISKNSRTGNVLYDYWNNTDVCYSHHASTSGWTFGDSGYNQSGLNVLAASSCSEDGKFVSAGRSASFWTSNSVNKRKSKKLYFHPCVNSWSDCIQFKTIARESGLNVRCIKSH